LLLTLKCVGQSINVDSLEKNLLIQIKNVLDAKGFEKLQKFKKSKCTTVNEFSQDEKTNLIETFYHNLVRIQVEYSLGESSISYYGYDISIINFGDEIIYYNILDTDTRLNAKYQNLLKMTELQNSYSKFYFDSLKINDLETLEKHTFGTSCGFGGETLKDRAEMEEHLSKMDISFFNSWISNPSLELKAYAYEAFRRLEKKGVKLSAKQRNILQKLEHENSYLNICNGCIRDSITMQDLIQGLKIE